MNFRTHHGLLGAVPFLLGSLRLESADGAAAGIDLSSLPWNELRTSLSDENILVETGPDDYIDQCYPIFPLLDEDRSHYDLLKQPSGVCMNQLFCGFKGCSPVANVTDLTIFEKWQMYEDFEKDNFAVVKDLSNPSYNIPNYVLFPKVAGDVHAAVAFAKEHGIELSVKNSGHSYTGASTKANTLHLNMNQYRRYASEPGSEALVECVADQLDLDDATLVNQPCRAALARNKKATLRVGGGENFDKVYSAVKAYNEAWNATNGDGYRHLIVGGGAGTISPLGWTFQGGLSGTTNGRTHGFGVDQVLQLEMVLPLGHHVRFGPTEWTEEEGFRYPRTTKVEGVCNSHPSKDESEWIWGLCSEPIDFDGLWFAQNGGGGGTYGIVTSIYLQLHEYLPLKTFTFGSGAFVGESCGLKWPEVFSNPLGDAAWEFVLDYFLNPSVYDVTDEMSDLCGAPSSSLSAHLFCYGDGAEAMLSSWKIFLASKKETLIEQGVSSASIETAATCVDETVQSWNDYAESNMDRSNGPHAGKASSLPLPSYMSSTELNVNVLLPREWILENKEYMASLLNAVKFENGELKAIEAPPLYLAFGGGATAHDQANSLSAAHRGAGAMLFQAHWDHDENFWGESFPAMYPQVTDGSSFPSFVGSNHVGPNTRGPMKADWTKPCSLNMTEEERDAKCVSLQEAVWGTETLARLEEVKDAVDPHSMLNCHGCVQNTKKMESTTASTVPSANVAATTTATDAPPDVAESGDVANTTDTDVAPDTDAGDSSAGWKMAIPYVGNFVVGMASAILSLP